MVEEEFAREGDPIGHNGKPLNGGTSMQTAIQILCTFSQRPMDVVPN